jgi:hypothetical protein
MANLRIGIAREQHRVFGRVAAHFLDMALVVQADTNDFGGIDDGGQVFDFLQRNFGGLAGTGAHEIIEAAIGQRGAKVWPSISELTAEVGDTVIQSDPVGVVAVVAVADQFHRVVLGSNVSRKWYIAPTTCPGIASRNKRAWTRYGIN